MDDEIRMIWVIVVWVAQDRWYAVDDGANDLFDDSR